MIHHKERNVLAKGAKKIIATFASDRRQVKPCVPYGKKIYIYLNSYNWFNEIPRNKS